MGCGCIWLELHNLLVHGAHQPALSAWLFRWFVGGAVTGQGGGATATENSSAKHLLPRRRPSCTMANSLLERWAKSSRMRLRPQGRWRVRRNINGCVVVLREEKKLVSVKTRLERSSCWPWLATTVQPRQGTFAWVDASIEALGKDVEQFFVSPRKIMKFFCCLISKDSKFNALVQKVIGASFFSRIHSGKYRKQ